MDNLTIDYHMGQDIMGQNIIHCAVGEPPSGIVVCITGTAYQLQSRGMGVD